MKYIYRIVFIALLIIVLLSFAACGQKDNENTTNPTIDHIEILESTIPNRCAISEFDVSNIKFVIVYSDDTKSDPIKVDSTMISLADLAKLETAGTQVITIAYKKQSAKFTITLVNDAETYYTVKIHQGVPIKVGNTTKYYSLNDNNYFIGSYPAGTELTISWVALEGYDFYYWSIGETKYTTSSIFVYKLTSDVEFNSSSSAVSYTVSFNTFCDDVVKSKTTNLLLENEIDTISLDGYVFLGWTNKNITKEQSLSGNVNSFVEFPLSVSRDFTLYAVWTPLNLQYLIDEINHTCEITGFTGNFDTLHIPESYNGNTIVSIDKDAFISSQASLLKTIYIPKTITTIEDGAFRDCNQLASIIVDSDSNSFESTSNNVLYTKGFTKLICYPQANIDTTYTIESNTQSISDYAFYEALLGGIILNSNTTNIGEYAFYSSHLDYLSFVSLSQSTLTLGDNLFNRIDHIYTSNSKLSWYQSQLPEYIDIITTSTDITKLGIYLATDYDEAKLLYRIIINKNFKYADNSVEIIGASKTSNNITIPKYIDSYPVTSIGEYAFYNCLNLESINIPKNSYLERISQTSFINTPWIENESKTNDLLIRNDIVYLFLSDKHTVNIGTNIKAIAEGAFRNDNNIEYLNIGTNTELEYIGPYAFYNCLNFKGFICPSNPTGAGLYLKNNVKTISVYAFYNTKIEKVDLQDSTTASRQKLEKIGDYAFANCYYLKSIEIGEATSNISTTAFINCYSLEEFILLKSNSTFKVFDGILYYSNNDQSNSYKLFNYPAGKLYDVFDPSHLKNYATSISIDESSYLSNASSTNIVGSVYFNGEYYPLNMDLNSNVNKSDLRVILDDTKISYNSTGEYLSETTAYSIDGVTGDIILNGDKYYYFYDSNQEFHVVLYDKNKKNYYYNASIFVKNIAEYSLCNSNIAALYIPESIEPNGIPLNAVDIPGLIYIEYENNLKSNYLDTFFNGNYPKYVVISSTIGESSIATYFAGVDNDLHYSQPKDYLFYNTDNYEILYNYNTTDNIYSIVRSSRTASNIVLEDSLNYNSTNIFESGINININSYAFYSYYLESITLKRIDRIEDYAFYYSYNLNAIYMDCSFIQNITDTSFNQSNLNNGLYIYDDINDISFYKDTPIWGLDFINYEDENGNPKYFSPYLITNSDRTAFAIIINDNITIGIYDESISQNTIEEIQNTVNKTGYILTSFTDNGVDIPFTTSLPININKILYCNWEPIEYQVYLTINDQIELNFDLYSHNSDESTNTYITNVIYGEEYSFETTSNYIIDWYLSTDSNIVIESIGIWSYYQVNTTIYLNYIISYNFIYNLEDDETIESGKTYMHAYPNKNVLDTPVKAGSTFSYWYYLDEDNNEIVLTNNLGMILDFNTLNKFTYEIYAKWE